MALIYHIFRLRGYYDDRSEPASSLDMVGVPHTSSQYHPVQIETVTILYTPNQQ